MDDALFQELLGSVEEAGKIRRGEAPAARSFRYEGAVLVEVKENGRRTWHIKEAARELARRVEEGLEFPADDPGAAVKTIRTALRQSQEGFAEMLGIKVGTLRNWEQGRRSPQGPARVLLNVAARHPEAVLDTVHAELAI